MTARGQRGISLIEALVAMAVMAFGMLGVLGLQSSLRNNADISKQRSEAIRLAQLRVENERSFSVLDVTTTRWAYDQIVTGTGPEDVTPAADANTTYLLTKTVTAFPAVGDEFTVAAHKQMTVEVDWRDRNNEPQRVLVNTLISATDPVIAGALSSPGVGAPTQRALGRSPAVPVGAVDLGNGTSSFTPPHAPDGVSWIFDNASGVITQLCSDTTPPCTDVNARLLTGYVAFAANPPTVAQAELPSGPTLSTRVRVNTTVPSGTTRCYTGTVANSTSLVYYCAMVLAVDSSLPTSDPLSGVPLWSGTTAVTLPGQSLAPTIASDPATDDYRICRYSPAPTAAAAVPAIRNVDHPLTYVQVQTALLAQNFLVIPAGDGTNVYSCPLDDPIGTPDLNSNTWPQQPSS